jgi:hypothetical protein
MIKRIIPYLTAIVVLVVYLTTLAPSVVFIDSGELSAVASTLGIAHPTGYPLFTIIGYLFTKLPIGSSEVYKLNLMAAVFCSLGIFIFYKLFKFLLDSIAAKKHQQVKSKTIKSQTQKFSSEPTEVIKFILSVFASLITAFSMTYWSQANAVEVYALHVFFIISLILIFLKGILNSGKYQHSDKSFLIKYKYYLIFSFVLGLSFTNHLTTILLAPACLLYFIYENYRNKKDIIKLLGLMSICFSAGLSVYLYFPIRLKANPLFIWGNPYNFERFWWHFTGKQFSVWIFSAQGSIIVFILLLGALIGLVLYGLKKKDTLNHLYHPSAFLILFALSFLLLSNSNEIVAKQFNQFLKSISTEYGPGLFVLALLGLYKLSEYNIKIYYFFILTFFSCLFYSVNYDIHDIDSYFLLSYITGTVWIGFGGLFIYEKFISTIEESSRKIIFSVILSAFVAVPFITNYKENDESKNYFVEEYTMNIFKNAEPNSIIISSQWDFWMSASWYFNYVKNIRTDLICIDKELLRRSWYFVYLKNHYPEIYENSKPEIEKFLIDLDKFEHNLPYNQQSIMKTFSDMLTSFVEKNPTRNIYTTWEIEQNKNEPFATDYTRLPDGLLVRLVKGDAETIQKSEIKVKDFVFTPSDKNNYYHKTLMESYALMLTNTSYILIQQNKPEDAKKYLNLALTAIPNFPKAMELKKKFNL